MQLRRLAGFLACLCLASLAGLHPATGEVWSGVSHVETSVPSFGNGLNVNQFLGAERFYDAGYDGGGTRVANIEAGHVWDGHQDLGHTNYIPDHSQTRSATTGVRQYDRHATWASSHIAGRGAGTYQGSSEQHRWGIAHGADLYSGAIASSWNSGSTFQTGFSFFFSSTATTYSNAMVTGLNGGSGPTADVVNSSWGNSDRDGFNTTTVGIDALVDQSGKIAVFSAGNDGPGTNTVGSPAAGYNTIAVAALGGANNYNTAASFSSRGPNSWWRATSPTAGFIDGTITRAMVDIAASGTSLSAAHYGGTTGGNGGGSNTNRGSAAYDTVQGTSFAAPITAGAAALIVDAGRDLYGGNAAAIDARVVKAVMLNSATKTTGWNNGQSNVGGVVTTSQSLDYVTGAGRLNLDAAFDQYVSVAAGGEAGTTDLAGPLGGVIDAVGWDFGTVVEGLSNVYAIGQQLLEGTELTATLTWFVERTVSNISNFSNAQEAHFANLDLRIFRLDGVLGQVFIAESISIANVVEHLFFTIPQSGLYGIEVRYTGDNWDFVGRTAEDYGLAWSGTAAPAAVPEPGSLTLCLLLAGPAVVILRRRRRAAMDS